jgi:hypothetical protein
MTKWKGKSRAYATDQGPREIIPGFMVERKGEQGDGWYLGVAFSGHITLTLSRAGGSIGLNPSPSRFAPAYCRARCGRR